MGENIIKNRLESLGYTLFKPESDTSHEFDKIAFKNGKPEFLVEVKTKPMMKKYRETGVNYNHYLRYVNASKNLNLPIKIYFVDTDSKSIYGNFLSELAKPQIQYNTPTRKPIEYPKIMNTRFDGKSTKIIYFPEQAMEFYWKITDKEIADILNADRK